MIWAAEGPCQCLGDQLYLRVFWILKGHCEWTSPSIGAQCDKGCKYNSRIVAEEDVLLVSSSAGFVCFTG